jgi:hypothetical protein
MIEKDGKLLVSSSQLDGAFEQLALTNAAAGR